MYADLFARQHVLQKEKKELEIERQISFRNTTVSSKRKQDARTRIENELKLLTIVIDKLEPLSIDKVASLESCFGLQGMKLEKNELLALPKLIEKFQGVSEYELQGMGLLLDAFSLDDTHERFIWLIGFMDIPSVFTLEEDKCTSI